MIYHWVSSPTHTGKFLDPGRLHLMWLSLLVSSFLSLSVSVTPLFNSHIHPTLTADMVVSGSVGPWRSRIQLSNTRLSFSRCLFPFTVVR